MQSLRYILRSITPLNVILFAALVIIAATVYPSLGRKATIELQAPADQAPPEKKEIKVSSLPDLSDYAVVGDLNIFHPDRKPPPPEEEEPDVVQAPLRSVEFTLYGTLVADDVTLAFVEERTPSRRVTGRRKRISVLRVGDTISGYTLKSIEPDRVIMVRGEEEITVPLYNPAAGTQQKTQPARQRRQAPPAGARPQR